MNRLDFLGLGGLFHCLEAFWWAELEPATVIHVPDRLQKHAHFRNASTDRKGHCTGMIKGIIPQTHLKKGSRGKNKCWNNLQNYIWKNYRGKLVHISHTILKWGQATFQNFLSHLCSHGDVGYRGHASTGLWLFVLCSGLFKHLLPLTKRHNTPADKTSNEV